MRKLLNTLLILTLFFYVPVNANAEVICVRKKIKVNKRGFVRLKNGVKVFNDTECAPGYEKLLHFDSVYFGHAKIKASDDTLHTYGGNFTSNATVTGGGGTWTITFEGEYPGLSDTDSQSNRDMVTVFSTSQSSDYNVTNVNVTSATSTEVKIIVFNWKSDDTSLSGSRDQDTFVGFTVGRPAS